MLIKFKKPDPRAGMTARMDSSRGQQLIDAGSADAVPDGADGARFADARAALDIALRQLPGDNDDPDYVVRAMRSHFGAVFTDADEAKVREVVVAPQVAPVEPAALADAPKILQSEPLAESAAAQENEPPMPAKPARGKK